MPETIRGKQEPPSSQKDAVSTPPNSTGKVDLKNKLPGAGKGADSTRSLTEKASKLTDASKVTGTSTPTSIARQRARDRRRGRVEASPEPESNSPSAEASSGRIKNLAGFWATPKDEVQVVRKKRLEVAERTEKEDSETTDSSDSDSDVDALKREAPATSETIEIEKGRAKSIANMWQNRKEEDLPAKRMPFKLDLQTEEPTVFENEPVVLEGVIRSDDRAVRDDIVIGRPGRIKDLAVNFATNTQSKQDTSSDDEEGSADKQSSMATKKTTEEVIERGKIQNVRERWKKRQQKSKGSDSDSDSSDESSATEDTPQRSSSRNKDQVIEQAKTRNLRERWSRQDGSGGKDDALQSKRQAPNRRHTLVTAAEYGVFENEPIVREDVVRAADEQPDIISSDKTHKMRRIRERWSRQDGSGGKDDATQSRPKAPNRLHSLVTATEYGVFENEPIVREDVVRADDEQPDIISCDKTQKMRRMWTMMDKEVMKDKEPVERTVKSAKKKDDKREAEPEAVKPQTTKPQKTVGRLQGVKDESPKPKEDAKPKKGHRITGREVESEKAASKDQKQPEPEGKGKLQRAFTIATAGENVKPSAPKSPSLSRYASRKKVA